MSKSSISSSSSIKRPIPLSEYTISPSSFENIEELTHIFRDSFFINLTPNKRFQHLNETLCQFILNAPPQSFLLKAVLDFFDRINNEKVLKETLDFTAFEFWLNHFSKFSDKQNGEIRAKIIGKNVPREEYQIFFPIGMGKTYTGTHFVTAHLSPDVDTMIASFWGWIDAFGARVSSGLHVWCLPGGPPDSPVTSFFSNLFGSGVFSCLARTSPNLALTAMDLLKADHVGNSHSLHPHLTLYSDINEIEQKMQGHNSLPVVICEQDGSLLPVGIVRAQDIRKKGLGTVSLRDFCNLEEMCMPSCLEIISVIDHHKSFLKTSSVPTALIGDAQSCNVLIAEQTFKLNDKYSLGGMTPEKIDKEIHQASSHLTNLSQLRILQRLLKRRIAHHQHPSHFIHPAREFAEYICFLQAIIDDTDLLTKVSGRDVECVAELLNRLKSLSMGQEVEIIHFDDIPKDKNFAKAAAKRILQQADMYALYKHIYSLRESEIELNLDRCIHGQPSNIFLDTKEQNRCARVGQTKMFASNFPFFFKNASKIRDIWLNQSQALFLKKSDINLYIHMISTITSAEEVYKGQIGPYKHQDELWLWIPPTQSAYVHLNHFLTGFQQVVNDIKADMSLEFLGSPSEECKNIFELHFHDIPKKLSEASTHTPIIILRFKPGALNSRKSMITPFLPSPHFSQNLETS